MTCHGLVYGRLEWRSFVCHICESDRFKFARSGSRGMLRCRSGWPAWQRPRYRCTGCGGCGSRRRRYGERIAEGCFEFCDKVG